MNQPSVPQDSGVYGMMEWENSIRKDFKFSIQDTGAPKWRKMLFKAINYFLKKAGEEPLEPLGIYTKDGVAQVLLGSPIRELAEDPNFPEERLVDVISDILTHEYTHKITMEEPDIIREFDEWKKKFGGRFSILPRMKKFYNAQELLAHGMMDDQLTALGFMVEHPSVDEDIRNAAAKIYDDIMAESKKNDAKANQELNKLRINPRIKMWEFLSAGDKVEKSDDRESWFDVLLMETEKAAGAVTTASPATSALFNVSYSGRKKRDDDEEESDES